MVSYEYKCSECKKVFTVERSMLDKSAVSCPFCEAGDVMKVFSPPAIIFRGSGFYCKDSNGKVN